MTWETWLAFSAASVLLLLIPGPTVMLVIGCALGHGRRSVAATAPGVALGDCAAMSLSMAGVGAALSASATLFGAVKLAGAAYLIWLGLRMWRSAGASAAIPAALVCRSPRGPGALFRDAFLVTLLNPKALVFFVAFAPQFVDPAAAFLPQAALMVATFTALGALNAVLFGLAAGAMRARLARPEVLRRVTRGGAGCLIGAGAATALSARP